MLRSLACLMLALQSLCAPLHTPQGRVAFAMKTGVLLRMHVVAQDDTEAMQQLKLTVRDAVRQTYDNLCPEPRVSMLAAAEAVMPELTSAAVTAARQEGFAGTVSVAIETLTFDARELDGLILPEGDYPALMIRLGDAQGHNWWGLVDPELSLRAAAVPSGESDGPPAWDWSLRGFLSALLGLPMDVWEGNDA